MVRNEQILRDILLKMSYDLSKTLSENVKVQNLTEQPNKGITDEDIYPIPGYITQYQPSGGVPPNNGSLRPVANYFPDNGSLKMRESIAVPSDYPYAVEYIQKWREANPNHDIFFQDLTAEVLNRLLPLGTVSSFTDKGKKYGTSILLNKETEYKWVFNGYRSKDGTFYEAPNPEDFMSWWEKTVKEWGTTIQIIGSILIIIAVEFFTAGTATPLVLKILLEIGLELALNIPISIAERSLGDPVAANLSIVFSFLPVLSPGLLRSMGLAGKLTKEMAAELSERVSKAGIKNADDMARFYDSLKNEPNGEALQYAFSRVIKQNPELIAKDIQQIVKQTTKSQKFLKKLAFKDRDWWKELGMQGGTALTIVIWKIFNTTTFSQEQYKRMNLLVQSIVDNYGYETAQEFVSNGIDNPDDMKTVIDSLSSGIDTNTREGKKIVQKASKTFSGMVGDSIKQRPAFHLLVRAKSDSIKAYDNLPTPTFDDFSQDDMFKDIEDELNSN